MTEIPILCKVKALYTFQSNDPSSLSFTRDDQIDVLNKLPSGWWDGLCNGVRGWFPSNYVTVIQEMEEFDMEEEDDTVVTQNKEYRLSLAYNSNASAEKPDNWIIQRSDDGLGVYYFNPLTGEMKVKHPEDQESEDEDISSIDLQNWSDQSTLQSVDEKPQWTSRVTSQQGKQYSSDTQSITSSIETSSFSSQPPQLLPRSPSRKPSVRINSNEPLNWNKISNNIAVAIYQLTLAAKNNQPHLYTKLANDIVNSIRFMLIASSTVDKDSTYIKTNANLRTHHRAMMACMSKLVLSAQTSQSILISDEEQQANTSKILSESSELLLSIRNFVGTCQTLKLPLTHTDPQWIEQDALITDNRTSIQTRYTLQLNLAENLETMGTCIQDLAETIIKCISSHLMKLDKQRESPDRMSLAAVLFTHFRNLSNQTGLFLGYLDETDFSQVQEFPEYKDLQAAKQLLADSLGLLFFKLQDLTNESLPDFNLRETEAAAGSLYEPIECICESVLQLTNKIKSRSNSSASFLIPSASTLDFTSIENNTIEEEPEEPPLLDQRHKSEITPPSQPLPYPMQRSQTAPSASTHKLKKFFGDEAPLPENTSKATTDEQPDYLKYDHGPNEIVFNMEGNVKGGTLPALVERLTLHDYLDMNFINTFLLTYRSFCSSNELLNLLEARYNLACPEGLAEQDAFIWEEKKLKLVRLRVFNVLKNWLDLYYNEDDSVLLDRLLEFTQTHVKKTLKFSNGQLESLIERRRNTSSDGGLKKMILTLPDPPEPVMPKNRRRFKLLDVDPLEMARQLTIMDFKLYSAIRPIECLDKAWSNEESNVAVNIRMSIEYCNQVTSWVSDVILSQHDIKKRSVLIKYWVQVAERCRILNNFNTCMAILSAFDNSSVGRLKRTWEVVGTRTNQTLQQIRKLMGANRNFVEYREMIHSVNPPCIPFLGIYLQDLTFIEDGNSNELKKQKDMINFAKRAKTAEVIREIQQYQSSLYQLKPVEEIQEFIKSYLQSTRDEEQLYIESLKLEPREREDEKITRLLQESGFL